MHGTFGGKPQLRESVVIFPLPDPEKPVPSSLTRSLSLVSLGIVPSTTPHDQSPIKDWAIALVAKESWLAPSPCMSQILGHVIFKGMKGIPAVDEENGGLIKLFSFPF